MTTLKTVEEIASQYYEPTRSYMEAEIERDRQTTADVLCALLEGEKRTKIEWANTTDNQKNCLLAEFDGHNAALTLAQDIIRKTLQAK